MYKNKSYYYPVYKASVCLQSFGISEQFILSKTLQFLYSTLAGFNSITTRINGTIAISRLAA